MTSPLSPRSRSSRATGTAGIRSDSPHHARLGNARVTPCLHSCWIGQITTPRYIARAIGRARTELAAFDAALVTVRVASYNLIRLSSVIPPNREVIDVDRCPLDDHGAWGDRLYCVYAGQRTSTPGEQVWAGVGWVQDDRTGRGLFVEHEGSSESASWQLRGAWVRERFRRALMDDPFPLCWRWP